MTSPDVAALAELGEVEAARATASARQAELIERRRELVVELVDAGVAQKVIAEAMGRTVKVVEQDLVTVRGRARQEPGPSGP